jgi:hypothetical protein
MAGVVLALALMPLSSGCGGSASTASAGDAGVGAATTTATNDELDGGSDASDEPGDRPADGAAGADSDRDGATADAARSDAGVVAGDGGAPAAKGAIAAPAQAWTWVPFSNAFCANGSTIGIGVNPSTASSDVVVYFEGGGACWSEETCYTVQSAAFFVDGYNEGNFKVETTDPYYLAMAGGFFDRTAAANPFKDASFVYVPYCTGDLHGGSNVVEYGSNTAKHVGYQNFSAFLERLVPTFPSAQHVFLTGSSAGGDGALLNFGQTQRAFSSARVDVIDDSGTLMPPDIEADGVSIEPFWRTQWNLAAALPPDCAGCTTALSALYGYYAASFPSDRFALLSYSQDSVIPAYYGITTAEFTSGLDEDLMDYFAPNANAHYFVNSMFGHVLWFEPSLATGSTTVQGFVTKLAADDPSWASVSP